MVLKESERLSSDLTELIDFKLRLEDELQSSENRIKVIKACLCEICGSAFGYGEKGQISTLRRKIELANGRGSYGIIHPNDLAKILESR